MSREKVSVIMSVYAEPISWIEMSINSVLEQDYNNIELIIIYDNPLSNEIWEYLLKYSQKDNRIILLHNDENLGLTRSLNKALAYVTGDYIARIDADDIWVKDKLQKQMLFMQSHRNISVCGTWVHVIDEDGELCGCYRYVIKDSDIGRGLLRSNTMVHSSILIRTSAVSHLLPQLYNEQFKTAQDLELWTHLYVEGCEFANIDEYLVYYRKSSKQISKIKQKEQSENADIIRMKYISNIYESIGITDYMHLSCKEISKSLSKVRIPRHFKVVVYSHLLALYVKLYKDNLFRLFWLLIARGDIFRISIKELYKKTGICRKNFLYAKH